MIESAGDVIRWIYIVTSTSVAGMIFVVIRLHFRVWAKVMRAHDRSLLDWRTYVKPGVGAGLTPLHVWLVSTAQMIYVVESALSASQRLGTSGGASYLIYMGLVANVLTFLALLAVGYYQRARVRVRPVPVTVLTESAEEVVIADDTDPDREP